MYEEIINKIRAEFPKHHIEIDLYPSGGMIDADPCDECGSTQWATATWKTKRGQTIDSAIAELKQRLSDSAGAACRITTAKGGNRQ